MQLFHSHSIELTQTPESEGKLYIEIIKWFVCKAGKLIITVS